MSKTFRTKKQVSADKRALKTLQKTGLYTGKIDFRRAPTPYQKSQIRKFSDVIAGKAAVVRPQDPKAYRDTFRTKGDAVIIPRDKGEKIGLSKTGKITRTRKTRTGKQKRTIIPSVRPKKIKPGAKPRGLPAPAPGKAMVFYLPFRRGRGKGQTTQWIRFSYDGLKRFLHEYDLTPEQMSDWLRYVEIEDMDEEYERRLDDYRSGEFTEAPSNPIDHGSSRYQRTKRKLKADVLAYDEAMFEDEDEDEF
jgi:hypothetical protein